MTPGGWFALVADRLESLRAEGRWRAVRPFDARGPEGRLGSHREVVSFASNDYLGLSAHPAVVAAAHEALDRWGAGAGASRLVTGSRPVHQDLEEALAEWKGMPAALCFPNGYAANLAVLATLGGPGTRVLSDEYNHASIVDGCRLARGEVSVYRHADPEHVEALLSDGGGPAIVVTDSVFSMDGDVAPIAELAAACRRRGALLILDEAHAVLGPAVTPAAFEDCGLVRVGTLSKALGSMGGFVAASRPLVDLLVNAARPFIFTTALSPADAAGALAALRVVRSAEGDRLRDRLVRHVGRVAPPGHATPIVPIVLGTEERALVTSAALLDEGVWVPAIRPPTVPRGTSRLRVTLSAAHTDEHVACLVRALAAVGAVASSRA